MKCPNDQTEMEKGLLLDGQGVKTYWSKVAMTLTNMFGFRKHMQQLIVWNCSKCGKVELYTETKKENT